MTNNQIQTLHKLYIDLTGINLPLPVSQYWIWEQFIARGHGEDQLRIVIKYLKRGISNQERRGGCLKFTNLLGDIDHFAEELAMAQKEFRKKPAYSPGKQSVLRATGRPDEPPTNPAISAAQVIERTKLASMLNRWKAAHL